MKSVLLKALLGMLLLTLGAHTPGYSQVVTEGPDSTVVRTDAEPLPPEQKGLSGPGKAALLSAIVPGLGQAYNKSYWKIPIIYATGAVVGYFLKTNSESYQDYKQAVQIRLDADPNNDEDQFTERLRNFPSDDQRINSLKRARDTYRRWRDYNVLYCIVAYGLNVTEAYVHAHLKGFDVSEELSLKVQPNIIQTNAYSFVPAFSFSINLKK